MTLYMSAYLSVCLYVCLSVCLRLSLTARDPDFPFLFSSPLCSPCVECDSLPVSDFPSLAHFQSFLPHRSGSQPGQDGNKNLMYAQYVILGCRGGVKTFADEKGGSMAEEGKEDDWCVQRCDKG